MKKPGCIPEGDRCPICHSTDRAIKEIQLNLKQWRCTGCNRFLDHISLPGKLKATKTTKDEA